MDLYSSYDSVQSIQPYSFGTEIEVASGMNFEVDLCFLFVIYGSYGIVHIADYGHEK
jgi:hypothetical protein